MRTRKRIIVLLVVLLSVLSAPVRALDSETLNYYAQNSILFYDPDSCTVNGSTPEYDNLVIGSSSNERLEEVVKNYGELAMDMQREWGTPWEVVFAQMMVESNVGTSGVAVSISRDNQYYNWLGITGSGGKYSVGTSYSSGREWAQYKTIENMIRDWAGEYVARNGYYDKAFINNLSPNSYDLRGFLVDFISVYAPSEDGNNVNSYLTNAVSYINGSITDIRKKKGWPSSAELAMRENITIGGRHPIEGQASNSEDNGGAGGCVLLRSSPDYESEGYKDRLRNLRYFNQESGFYSGIKMCEDRSYYVKEDGCGMMALAAAWYMFSGQGNRDEVVFRDLLVAAEEDEYNACYASEAENFGENLNSFTSMTEEKLFRDKTITDHWDEMVTALKSGKKIIILVDKDDGTLFTKGGHYLMLDHYNEEKDMIYLFDSTMSESRYAEVAGVMGNGVDRFDGEIMNGIYVSHDAMNRVVVPAHGFAFSYDGCYREGANNCRSTYNGLIAGGMTYDEATEFLRLFSTEANKARRGHYGTDTENGTVIGDGFVYDAGCVGGTLNNCVALSQWFLNNYTRLGPRIGSVDGGEYVDLLISQYHLEDGGRVPRAYAIFSDPTINHTGIVLGINEKKGEVYIGEASCSHYYSPRVSIHSLDEMTNGDYVYAYTDAQLNMGNDNITRRLGVFNR